MQTYCIFIHLAV